MKKDEIILKNWDLKYINIKNEKSRKEWIDLLYENFSEEKRKKLIEKIRNFDWEIFLQIAWNKKVTKEKAIKYLEEFNI